MPKNNKNEIKLSFTQARNEIQPWDIFSFWIKKKRKKKENSPIKLLWITFI